MLLRNIEIVARTAPLAVRMLLMLWMIPLRLVYATELEGPQVSDDGPDDWHERLSTVESEYAELLTTWSLTLTAANADRRTSALATVEKTAQIQVLRAHIDELYRLRDRLSRERAAAGVGLERHQDAVDRQLEAIDNARRALTIRRDTILAELGDDRDSQRVHSALNTWWTSHLGMDWRAHSQGDADPRSSHELALRAAASAHSAELLTAVQSLLLLAQAEDEARDAYQQLLMRPHATDLTEIEEQVAENAREIRNAEERLRSLEGSLHSTASASPSAAEAALREDTQRVLAEYRALQGALSGPSPYTGAVSAERWCDLFTQGGVLAALLGDTSGPGMLRVAVSAYGGTCAPPPTSVVGDVFMVSIWTEARQLASQNLPTELLLDEVDGYWRLDGIKVEGAGRIVVTLTPGLHRLEYIAGTFHPVDALVEEVDAGEQLGFRVDRGRIVMDTIPKGAAWVVPVRSDGRPREPEVEATPDPSLRLGMYATTVQFDGRAHTGGSAEFRVVEGRWRPIALEAGLVVDWLGAPASYSYGGSATPALLRLRGTALVRPLFERGPFTPTVQLSLGVIPPFQALTLDLSGGLELDVRPGWAVSARLGLNTSIWRGDMTWLEPTAQLGVVRAFGPTVTPRPVADALSRRR